MIQLYKDGDRMAIVTDEADERRFMEKLCTLLSAAIDSGRHAGDWDFQLTYWLPQIVEICCKYRGYKADVESRFLYTAGNFDPSSQLMEFSIDGRNKVELITTTMEPKLEASSSEEEGPKELKQVVKK